ncbi:hypothetical protein [Burkholderia contaminans]|uniref:hypothetical protein n=1 Tax=Burkholderia contaminans TaxID=488447 RepID=UPI001F130A56|nr:hypothetical protein [Burkholderia contaminans]UMY33533.1 hypothetical protein MMB18_38245 [Burkholderia contaminans]
MGYALFPLAVLMFFGGLISQAQGLATSVIGAGPVGLAETRAAVVAESAIAYADACLETATANPGLTGGSIVARLPNGVATPAGANCRIDAVAGGGRLVYAWAPVAPGAISRIRNQSEGSSSWYFTATAVGVASGIATGDVIPVPAEIPMWNVLYHAEVRP